MADGAKLAIAILVMWLSLVFFFFAFHPGGVKNVSNPGQMLRWLADEFSRLAGGGTSAAKTKAFTTASAAEEALAYPGYATGTSDTGSASGVQLA